MSSRTIPLPPSVVAIYRAVEELEERYPGRKFTPDGHLVGSGPVPDGPSCNIFVRYGPAGQGADLLTDRHVC